MENGIYCFPLFEESEELGSKIENIFNQERHLYSHNIPVLLDYFILTYLNPDNNRFTLLVQNINQDLDEYIKVEFAPIYQGQNPVIYDGKNSGYYSILGMKYQDFVINDLNCSRFFHVFFHYIGSMLRTQKTLFNTISLGNVNLPDKERICVKNLRNILEEQSYTSRLLKYVDREAELQLMQNLGLEKKILSSVEIFNKKCLIQQNILNDFITEKVRIALAVND